MKRGRAVFHRGVTLVELLVTIMVIAVAGSALVGTLGYLSGQGSDYLLQAQAQSIADAYLGEITGKSFADPDGADGEADRQAFDDVDDYNGLNTPVATDEAGNVVGNFRVRVNLTAGGLATIPAADTWRIDVTVDYGNTSVLATGFKTRHP
ncbi:MAG TPA: type II secretion system protein [Steroidobacteraceae bacterium]|jgi:MSHA pilin protein MshD